MEMQSIYKVIYMHERAHGGPYRSRNEGPYIIHIFLCGSTKLDRRPDRAVPLFLSFCRTCVCVCIILQWPCWSLEFGRRNNIPERESSLFIPYGASIIIRDMHINYSGNDRATTLYCANRIYGLLPLFLWNDVIYRYMQRDIRIEKAFLYSAGNYIYRW